MHQHYVQNLTHMLDYIHALLGTKTVEDLLHIGILVI